MIVIAATARIRPEARAKAERAARAMAAASRREAGCVAYRFGADLEDPAVLHVFEEWESQDALARHFQTEHMRVFQAQLAEILAEAPAIRRYVVESAGPLGRP